MDAEQKKGSKSKVIIPIVLLLAVIIGWQVLVLELLKNKVIGTVAALVMLILATAVICAGVGLVLKSILAQVRAVVGGNLGEETDDKLLAKMQKLSKRDDELGRMATAVQKFVTNFATVLTGIQTASKELGEVSDEFQSIFTDMKDSLDTTKQAVDSIAQNTIAQADQTTEMKDRIDATSESIACISENIGSLNQSAEKMGHYNQSAEEIMEELITISSKSGEAIENVRNQTELTNQSAQQIQTVTQIIADISNQTNLLALNASIEAARAGENGRGFAVVAEQIRLLADQSKESTEQISKLISELIENAHVSVQITQTVSEAVTQQNDRIQSTEEIFKQLNTEIEQVGSSITEISGEVKELQGYSDEIEKGIESLSSFAEENAENARKTTTDMEQLLQIVDNCNDATNRVVSVSEELIEHIKNSHDKVASR